MTIEEREEYEAHVKAGTVVYAGVDYGAIDPRVLARRLDAGSRRHALG